MSGVLFWNALAMWHSQTDVGFSVVPDELREGSIPLHNRWGLTSLVVRAVGYGGKPGLLFLEGHGTWHCNHKEGYSHWLHCLIDVPSFTSTKVRSQTCDCTLKYHKHQKNRRNYSLSSSWLGLFHAGGKKKRLFVFGACKLCIFLCLFLCLWLQNNFRCCILQHNSPRGMFFSADFGIFGQPASCLF